MKSGIPSILFVALLLVSSVSHAICVRTERANLRGGPGTKFKITWEVGQFMPLRKLSSKGGWIQVQDVDGEKHWIAGSQVTDDVDCVVVSVAFTNLRQGPGAQYPLAEIGVVDKYTPFKKLDRDGAWILLEDEYSERFWVFEKNVWYPVSRSKISF